MGIRGVWSLENVENKYPQDDWVEIPNVWFPPSGSQVTTHGYHVGGDNPSKTNVSKVDKLTYATDTISVPSSTWGNWTPSTPSYRFNWMAQANNGAFAIMSSYQLSADGTNPLMWKHTFSTDIFETSPGLNPINGLVASMPYTTGNNTHSWWHSSTNGYPGAAQKVTYATETYTPFPSSTGFTSNSLGSYSTTFSNQEVGGYTPASASHNPGASQVKKLTFATDTFTNNGWIMPSTGNPYGAVDAGIDRNTALLVYNGVNKLTLNNSTVASSPNMVTSTTAGAGHSNLTTAGYFSAAPSSSTTIYKVSFSTYAWSSTPATLSAQRQHSVAYSGASHGLTSGVPKPSERWVDGTEVYGGDTGIYLGCGYRGGNWDGSGVDKMDFSSETMSESTTIPSNTILGGTAAGSSGTKGYFFGGQQAGSARSTIWKYTYSSDSLTLSAEPYLGGPSYSTWGAAFDSENATYYGGYGPGTYDGRKVYKLDYSDDSSALIPALSPGSGAAYGAKQGMSTVSNIGAGIAILAAGTYTSPTARSYTFKVNYSSETIARVPGADYPFAAQGHTSIGSPNAGYFAYGFPFGPAVYPGGSALYKYDYSSDTFSTPGANMLGWGPIPDNVYPWQPGDQMAYSNSNRGVTGNSTNAYWVGGIGSNNATYMGSNIDKLTYATEVISTLPGGDSGWNPSTPSPYKYLRYYGHGATSVRQSNRTKVPPVATPTGAKGPPYELAYKGGGSEYPNPAPGYYSSNISKFNMQTDVFTSNVATMPGRRWLSASSSSTTGYFAGGSEGDWGPNVTTISKIVYSTETSTVVPGQIQNSNTGRSQATGNNTAMYYIGGLSSNRINKMPYSTETCAWLANMPYNRYEGAAWSNQTQGYAAGGHPSDASSSANKIVYSSDTVTTTPGTTLIEGIKNQQAASNATNGYIFGGALPGSSYKSTTSKWVMSNDTVSRIPAANMPFSIVRGSAGGSPTVAVCFGGWNQPSPGTPGLTEKLTYATDTWTNLGQQPEHFWSRGFSEHATASATNSGNAGSEPNLI